MHYLAEPLLYDKNRPKHSIRITKILAACSFLATAAGATIFLFARQAGEGAAAHIVTLTAIALWTVAEALPLTAGFVGAWAHMLARPALEERRLNDVKEAVATRQRLLERLQHEVTLLTGRVTVPTDTVRPFDRVGVRTTSLLMVPLVLVASGATPVAGQSTGRLCAVFADRTVSVDSSHRAAAVALVSRSLPELVRALDCRELVVGTFADEGPWAPRLWFRVPEVASAHDCSGAEPARPQGTRAVLAGLRGFQDHFKKEAVERCEREQAEARRSHHAQERTFLADARAILEAPPLARTTKTDLHSAAPRHYAL